MQKICTICKNICNKYATNMQKNAEKMCTKYAKYATTCNKIFTRPICQKICKICKKICKTSSLCKSFSNMQKLRKLCSGDFADHDVSRAHWPGNDDHCAGDSPAVRVITVRRRSLVTAGDTDSVRMIMPVIGMITCDSDGG